MVVGVKTRLKRQQCEIHIKIRLVLYREGRKKVEKVIRVEMVEIGAKKFFLASTIPGDHSGGPA